MPITTFEGPQGSGKTLATVSIIYEDFINKQRKVFSNNHLKFEHTYFDVSYFVDHIADDEMSNSSILLDEAYIYLDSRTSAGKLNKLFTYFLVETRKRTNYLYICTHHIDILDKRLRRAVDYRCSCRYLKEQPCTRCNGTGAEPRKRDLKGEPMECSRCLGYGETGWSILNVANQHTGARRRMRIHAPRYWHLYETEERVPLTRKQININPKDL